MRALRIAAALGLGWAAARLAAADKEPPINVAKLFAGAQVLPELGRAAQRAGFPISGLQPGNSAVPAPGDQEIALVAYYEGPGAAPVQWLLRLGLATPSDPSQRGQDLTYYSTVGDAFVFHSASKAAIDLDLLGPTGAPLLAVAPRRTVGASADFLMLDISRGTAAIHRIRAQIKDRPKAERGNFGVAPGPFPPAEVARDTRQLEPYHLTVEDRRSFAGMLPALTEFLNVVRDTPGLQDILWKVFERPSLLDMVRHIGNENPNFAMEYADAVDPGDLFGTPGGPHPPAQLLVVAFQLFNKPVLQIALLAVPPQPPLEVTAGILAAAAWGPAHPERTVVVRVISARPGR